MKSKIKRLLVVAGDSGGHIIPALTLSRQWKKNNIGNNKGECEIIFVTNNRPLDKYILNSAQNITYKKYIFISKFIKSRFWEIPIIFFQVLYACAKSLYYLIKYKPEKIITTGGLVSIPVCLIGWLLRYPVEIHELNVIPGKAIKFLFPFSNKIFIVFSRTKDYCRVFGRDFSHKCVKEDYPVRFSANAPERIKSDKAGLTAGFVTGQEDTYTGRQVWMSHDKDRKTLFILGGSQGSEFLNNIFKDFLLSNKGVLNKIQVIHQIGNRDITLWENFYKGLNIPAYVFSYNEKIDELYSRSDLIICRAGAGTLFETLFFKKKCLAIPLVAKTTSHQVENALEMSKEHPELFTVLDQESIKKDITVFDKALSVIMNFH